MEDWDTLLIDDFKLIIKPRFSELNDLGRSNFKIKADMNGEALAPSALLRSSFEGQTMYKLFVVPVDYEVGKDAASFVPSTFSASKIAAHEGLISSIPFPYPSSCFCPSRKPISILMNAKINANSNNHFATCHIISKEEVRYLWTYKLPEEIEEKFSRLNLDCLIENLMEITKIVCVTNKIHCVTAATAMINKTSLFASSSSLSEPVVSYVNDGVYLGFVTSGSTSLSDDMMVTSAEAVVMGAECAMVLLHALSSLDETITYADIAIPYLTTFNKKVQFGAVYLIEKSFPNVKLLSNELDLLNDNDRREIKEWMFGIAALIKHYITIIGEKKLTRKHPFQVKQLRLTISLKDKILKPVSSYTTRDGIIGYPDTNQPNLKTAVDWNLRDKIGKETRFSSFYSINISGYPIMIYPDLKINQWQRADDWIGRGTMEAKQEFIKQVEIALQSFECAGVIHTDARLANIFVRDSGSILASMKPAATTDSISQNIEIIFIDWDDCVQIGEPIPEYLRQTWADRHIRTFDTASTQFHSYYLNQIMNSCSTSCVMTSKEVNAELNVEEDMLEDATSIIL